MSIYFVAPIRRAPLSSDKSCLKHLFRSVEGQGHILRSDNKMIIGECKYHNPKIFVHKYLKKVCCLSMILFGF